MGDAAFRTGLAVYRERYRDVVSLRQRRRRTVAAGLVALVVGAVVTTSELVWRWSPALWPLTVIGIACFAAAAGLIAPMFLRATPRDEPVDWSFRASGDWRRQERVARQFRVDPPPMDPEDRDLVLAGVERSRDGLVLAASRTVYLPGMWLLAWIGALVTGLATSSIVGLVLPPVLALLQSSSFLASVSALGRAELARRRALALPSAAPAPPRTWPRGAGPSGSKTALPGER